MLNLFPSVYMSVDLRKGSLGHSRRDVYKTPKTTYIICGRITTRMILYFDFIKVELELQSMVHHRKYPLFTSNLYLGVKVTQNVAQYLLHNVTYAPVKCEVAMSKG